MAKRFLLKFRNLDRTLDINDRFSKLIKPGIIEGGLLTTVSGQLKVDLHPYKLTALDGMVVEETSTVTRLNTPDGQTTVIAIKAVYQENNNPIVQEVAYEETIFNGLPDIDQHIVVAHVSPPALAVQVVAADIDYSPRDVIDPIGRKTLRGVIANAGLLPASHNVLGDMYVVVDGLGGPPNIYIWEGTSWEIVTDFVALSTDLLTHRSNLFVDEKHLTDNEKLAVVGTSGTAVSGSNKLVDNADTRIPTQAENDALVGSDGSPSGTNKYVTEQYPLAVPDEKVFSAAPIPPYCEILGSDGPVYVGKSGLGSANQYFKFYDLLTSKQREYITATGVKVNVTGVYLDSLLTSEINPATNPNVDADGFFSGGSLFLSFNTAPDSGLRVLYEKRQILGTFPLDAIGRRSRTSAQTNADTLIAIESIKGRDFDVIPPVNEQNIELRKDIVDIKEYVSSAFSADFVVSDFYKTEGVPDFGSDFVKNVGIPVEYEYQNSPIISYTYNNILGRIQYSAAVNLSTVVVGNVFVDGSLEEFKVVAVNDGADWIDITKRNGTIPASVNTTATLTIHGSIKTDANPRKINLANLDGLLGRERIPVREIEPVFDEFNLVDGNIAFQIRKPLRTPYYREPRVRFYGGFKNTLEGNKARVVATSTGRISVTGFFTDLDMLVDLRADSPNIDVYVDGIFSSTIDLSRTNTVAEIGEAYDIQQQTVSLATGLPALTPHTVEIVLSDDTDDFIIYGFDLWSLPITSTYVLPGRAFVQSDLYKLDTLQTLGSSASGPGRRGVITKRFINRSLALQATTYELTDFDGVVSAPTGIAVPTSSTITISSGLAKLSYFKTGDVVRLSTTLTEEIKIVSTISLGVVTFTSPIVAATGAASLYHMCSTEGESADPTKEQYRFMMTDFGLGQLSDLSTPFTTPSDKVFTLEDGTTIVAAKQVNYTSTGIDGADIALQLNTASSELHIKAVCSGLDLLVVNTSSIAIDFHIDGSGPFNKVIPGGGMIRFPIFTNARYMSHDVLILSPPPFGLSIVGIVLHEPTVPTKIEGTLLSTQNVLARYIQSHNLANYPYLPAMPVGSIFVDPTLMGAVFVNGTGIGTDWSYDIDFTKNLYYAKFNETDKEGSYVEFYVHGGGFEVEFFAGLGNGIPNLYIDNLLATSGNFVGAIFKNVNSASGAVDMYSAAYQQKRFGVMNINEGRHLIRLEIPTPRIPGTGGSYAMNITGVHILNTSGALSYTPARGFRSDDFITGLDFVRDERNFDPGIIVKEQIPVFRTIVAETRAQKVPLLPSSTSISVVFSSPMSSADYSIIATMYNPTDVTPEFQPIVITSVSTTGFTAKWNDPLDTANYFLSYNATIYI